MHFYFYIFILFKTKCLQLDSKFIANNLREKDGFETFFISQNVFTYNWPPSWMPSWINRNAQ